MKLFHAFPRPRHHTDANGRIVRDQVTDADRHKGLELLRLILTHGLLCTPEKFKLYPNYNTLNEEKKQFLSAQQHHDEIVQSRACFTLTDALELTKENKLTQNESHTHADLFGEFAIGLDPIDARELGIIPTVYYYKHDVAAPLTRTAGLGSQIVERLDEIRCLLSILSYVEAKVSNMGFPTQEELKRMGIQVKHQKQIESELLKMTPKSASDIFHLFCTDRVPAWNIVDFVNMLLSLYQTTDSTLEDAPLAFFQQREWRLIHHKMDSLIWFGLGEHSSTRDPYSNEFKAEKEEIKTLINEGSQKNESYFSHCWVLTGTTRLHFRNFVREIIVPENFCREAEKIVSSLSFRKDLPIITPLPPRWKIINENGIPRIIY